MRSRSIKPGFFKNEELALLPFEARLLFVGLWCMADRSGRMENRPGRIKAELCPYDDVDVIKMCADLEGKGFISMYPRKTKKYIEINNFSRHQYPHIKEAKSTIPAPCSYRTSPMRKRLTPDSLEVDSITESVDLDLTPDSSPVRDRATDFLSSSKTDERQDQEIPRLKRTAKDLLNRPFPGDN